MTRSSWVAVRRAASWPPGLTLIRQAAASAMFSPAAEAWPGADVGTRASLRSWIRRVVGSYYHPVGTCRMGPDADAVVDLQLRVRGIDGLRIADASVIPVIPNAPVYATVLAIAEKSSRDDQRPVSPGHAPAQAGSTPHDVSRVLYEER